MNLTEWWTLDYYEMAWKMDKEAIFHFFEFTILNIAIILTACASKS